MVHFAYILLSIGILLVMVLIHESGHYTTAKILGFTVEEFSIGFGPKLFSRRRKNGELFSVRILPLGGFCAFYGETDDQKTNSVNDGLNSVNTAEDKNITNEIVSGDANSSLSQKDNDDDLLSFVMKSNIDEDKNGVTTNTNSVIDKANEQSVPRLDKDGKPAIPFNSQKPWKRIIVLFGGVLFNFLSAIVFSLIYIWVVGYSVPQVGELYVDVDGNVCCPQLSVGDIILSVDDTDITLMRSFSDIVSDIGGNKTVKLKINRNGNIVEELVERKTHVVMIDNKKVEYVGFGFKSEALFVGNNAGTAFKYCVPYTGKLSWSILGAFGDIITGKQSITSMSGPIGSIGMMADVSAADWRNVLILLPLLASNLAIFNLIPFPALDGAHIVFTIIEWIRKKPINRNVENTIHFVGMIVLLLFVCIVDIVSLAI